MNLNIKEKNGITILTPLENLNFITAGDFKNNITKLLKSVNKIILDMAELTLIDSSGVGVIIETNFKLKKSMGNLVICNMCKKIQSVFKLANLLNTLTIKESLNAALEFFE